MMTYHCTAAIMVAYVLIVTHNCGDQNSVTLSTNFTSEFTCKKDRYPFVRLVFRLPPEWIDHYASEENSTWGEPHINMYYKHLITAVGVRETGEWIWLRHKCTLLNILQDGTIRCRVPYMKSDMDHADIDAWWDFKITYVTSRFNKTIRSFNYMPGNHHRRLIPDSFSLRYDFNNRDMFKCLGELLPVMLVSGECDRIHMRWYWPPGLYGFRSIASATLNISNQYYGGTVFYEQRIDINTALSDFEVKPYPPEKAYRVCMRISYLSDYVKPEHNTSTFDACQETYTYCKQDKKFLTIAWTKTIITSLSMVVFVLLVLLTAACYKLKYFRLPVIDGEEEQLIQPVEENVIMSCAEDEVVRPNRGYTRIEYPDLTQIRHCTIPTPETPPANQFPPFMPQPQATYYNEDAECDGDNTEMDLFRRNVHPEEFS